MKTATLRLFNAVQVSDKKTAQKHSKSIFERTIRHGYVLDPAIPADARLLDTIESVVGLSGEKANAAFHKSWAVVQDSPMEALVMQQIMHYFSTYGFEALGIYSEESVYIPREILNLPELNEDIPLTVIRAMTKDELLDAIVKLGSGIALAKETLDGIMEILKANDYDGAFAKSIGNRELKALLYDYYDIVPEEPVEFLRHLVSKLTDESLLIKNEQLIGKLKNANGKFLDVLLKDAPDDLASIFFRYKPLFLALKSISGKKTFFNRLRKQADRLHKPLPEDYLNAVAAKIKRGELNLEELQQRLEKAGVFRKIRLAYALNHRLHASDCTVYRIRNGRGWATGFDWPRGLEKITRSALEIVIASIAADLEKNVAGKIFYIPENVHYALPATEKQFTGNLPTGTAVSVPEDMIAGIHWQNTKKRVDLDLSAIGESGKIGWDAAYRSGDNEVLFSGDMTDAPPPHGASELFYLKRGQKEARILWVNYYNFQKGDEVGAKVLVAHESPKNFGMNYMVDTGNIVASVDINISKKQNILGLVACKEGENHLYFANISLGNSITASNKLHSRYARKYLLESTTNALDLRKILQMAGATVIDDKGEEEFCDLSPEKLDKSTLIDLINPQ